MIRNSGNYGQRKLRKPTFFYSVLVCTSKHPNSLHTAILSMILNKETYGIGFCWDGRSYITGYKDAGLITELLILINKEYIISKSSHMSHIYICKTHHSHLIETSRKTVTLQSITFWFHHKERGKGRGIRSITRKLLVLVRFRVKFVSILV